MTVHKLPNKAPPVSEADEIPDEFIQVLNEWRAACVASDRTNGRLVKHASEDEEAAIFDRERQAIWRVIQTPCTRFWHLKERANFVMSLHLDVEHEGTPTDNRHVIALAGLVAELNNPPRQ